MDEAAPLIDPWRRRHYQSAITRRLPPHVTLLYPFVPAATVDSALFDELAVFYASFEPFAFALQRVDEFPGYIFLAPEPRAPFEALLRATWGKYPTLPPYGGGIAEPVPHLTVAEVSDEREQEEALAALREGIEGSLPLRCQADAVTLLEEREDSTWHARAQWPLLGAP